MYVCILQTVRKVNISSIGLDYLFIVFQPLVSVSPGSCLSWPTAARWPSRTSGAPSTSTSVTGTTSGLARDRCTVPEEYGTCYIHPSAPVSKAFKCNSKLYKNRLEILLNSSVSFFIIIFWFYFLNFLRGINTIHWEFTYFCLCFPRAWV